MNYLFLSFNLYIKQKPRSVCQNTSLMRGILNFKKKDLQKLFWSFWFVSLINWPNNLCHRSSSETVVLQLSCRLLLHLLKQIAIDQALGYIEMPPHVVGSNFKFFCSCFDNYLEQHGLVLITTRQVAELALKTELES